MRAFYAVWQVAELAADYRYTTPESAAVLKHYFAQCGSVTWAKVLDAGQQIPRLERAMAADPRLTQE